ncbi:MAG: sigma 54-interacting transcriptional regulator [Planctomycetes bacterium]|nr:sigma 54-interacting transcriptional regulator [Planctomycetota bacterium]
MPPPTLINNRYRTLRAIGEGGMGTVYLVEDQLRDNNIFALKMIRPGLIDATTVEHFKSEFESLTRLHHPALAEVYDFGIASGTAEYFFTQEYVHGCHFLDATRGLDPSALIPLIIQTCRVLEYIHARGLIHYDLKPTNIIITNAESRKLDPRISTDPPLDLLLSPRAYNLIKLLDFGLAGRWMKEGAQKVKGSIHYIAPELAQGLPADHRADLYSLGITLYHVVTGLVPFEADSSMAIIKKHIEERPRPPRALNTSCSEGLERVILRLLAKTPEERFQRAGDVIVALNRIAGQEYELETKETKKGYVLSAKFVGREKEFERLKALLREVERRAPTLPACVLVGGEAGIGKSRLTREFKVQCQLQKVLFAEGSSYEQAEKAYGPFIEVLREVVGVVLTGAAAGRPEDLALLDRYAPELVKLLPDLALSHPVAPTPELEPRVERLRLVDHAANFLLDAAARQPIILCLQDLHSADEASIELLRHLANNLHLRRSWGHLGRETPNPLPLLLVLGTYRDDEVAGTPLEQAVREMHMEGYLEEIRLRRFDVDDVRQLVASMFGPVAGLDGFSARVARETGGNPFFIQEVVMSLVEKELVAYRRGRWELEVEGLSRLQIPKTIDEVVRRRLSTLTPEELAILELLAVLERPAGLDLLSQLTRGAIPGFTTHLRSLEKRGFVLREELGGAGAGTGTGSGSPASAPAGGANAASTGGAGSVMIAGFRLVHATIQKVLYAELGDARRRELHLRIGEFLESQRRPGEVGHCEELARHFLRAGERDRGMKYGSEAGTELARIYANDDALEIYTALLKLPDLPADRAVRFRLDAADVHRLTGRLDESEEQYQAALASLAAGDPRRGGVHLHLSTIYQIRGQWELFEASIAAAKEALTASGDKHGLGVVYNTLGEASHARGEYERALRYCNVAVGIAEGMKDNLLLCRSLGNVGLFHRAWGQYDEAARYFAKAIRIAEETSNRPEQMRAFANMGMIHAVRGEFKEALGFLHKVITLTTAIGDKRALAAAHAELGAADLARGEYDEAMRNFERALRVAEEVRDKRGAGEALSYLGLLHFARGDYDQALGFVGRAARIAKELGDKNVLATSLGTTGNVHRCRGEYVEAEEFLTRALSIFEEIGAMAGTLDVTAALARLRTMLGDFPGARKFAERALTIARNRGMRIHEGRYLLLLAALQRMSGDVEAAAKSVFEVKELLRKTQQRGEQVQLLIEETWVALGNSDGKAAMAAASEAVGRARELGARPLLCPAHLAHAHALLAVVAPIEDTLAEAERALELADELRDPELQWQAHRSVGHLLFKTRNLVESDYHYGLARKLLSDVLKALPAGLQAAYKADPRRENLHREAEDVKTAMKGSRRELPAERGARGAAPGGAGATPGRTADAGAGAAGGSGAGAGGASAARKPTFQSSDTAIRNRLRDLGEAGIDDLIKVIQVTKRLNSELDLKRLLETIVDTAIELTRADRGFLILREGEHLRFEVSRNLGSRDVEDPQTKISKTIAMRVLDRGEVILTSDALADEKLREYHSVQDLKVRSILCVPLRVRARLVGALYLDSLFAPSAFGERETLLLEVVVDQAAVALEKANLLKETLLDETTGLHAANYMDRMLGSELARCNRYGRVVSAIICAVDRLKVLSDLYGPDVIPELLKGVAALLKAGVRNVDLVGRHDADGLLLLLPETERAEAVKLADRLRSEVEARKIPVGGKPVEVTLSMGVVGFPADGKKLAELAHRAREALYTAQREGGNRVVAIGEGVATDAQVKRDLAADADVDSLVLSRDGITVLGMVMKVINAGLDLTKVLDLSMRMILQVTRAERGFIMLKDSQGKLKAVTASNFKDEEVAAPQLALSHTLLDKVAETGEPVLVNDTLKESQLRNVRSIYDLQIRSILSVPIKTDTEVIGVVYVDNLSVTRKFTQGDLELLTAFAHKIAIPVENSRKFREAEEEAESLKRTVKANQELLRTKYSYTQIIGASKPMREIFRILDKVVETYFPVIIQGESGTGKELVAKAIHFNGPRKERAFVAENCAALPETLLESVLFGHMKGSFTGADKDKEGLFELANGGTLFLDEIGEMGLEMQKKFLRVLQEGEVRRVGGKSSVKIDVRIVCASNRDLKRMASDGSFREDLYYRLNVFSITLPPLRDRREDIPVLIEHFLEKCGVELKQPKRRVSREAMKLLTAFAWPGNIRQLENEVKRLVAFTDEDVQVKDLAPDIVAGVGLPPSKRPGSTPALAGVGGGCAAGGGGGAGAAGVGGAAGAGTMMGGVALPDWTGKNFDEIMKSVYLWALEVNGWSVEKTAKQMGFPRSTLYYRLKEMGITVKKKGG